LGDFEIPDTPNEVPDSPQETPSNPDTYEPILPSEPEPEPVNAPEPDQSLNKTLGGNCYRSRHPEQLDRG
jgi:hypothetical protein